MKHFAGLFFKNLSYEASMKHRKYSFQKLEFLFLKFNHKKWALDGAEIELYYQFTSNTPKSKCEISFRILCTILYPKLLYIFFLFKII